MTGSPGVIGSNFADTFIGAGFTGSAGRAGYRARPGRLRRPGGDDIITGNVNVLGQALTRANYLSATGAVTVDLAGGNGDGNASVGHDTLSNVSTLWGSGYNDTLRGSDNALGTFEPFDGRGGNDYHRRPRRL